MSLEGMRDLVREYLGQSLGSLQEEDRLAAAWPVACGRVLAERGRVAGYADGVVRIQVTDDLWLRQMIAMQEKLTAEMGRIAGVRVRGIHFELQREERG